MGPYVGTDLVGIPYPILVQVILSISATKVGDKLQ